MIEGLLFFLREGWKASKKYILFLVCGELIRSVQPFGNILLPKLIIDELLGLQRPHILALTVAGLVGFNYLCALLATYLSNESFLHRIVVSHVFVRKLSFQLYKADYSQIEMPDYLDLKQKAEKFIYGDMRGFGYILDSSVAIVSRCVTFAGIIAIIATLNWFVVVAFILLVLLSIYVENWAEQKCVALYMNLASIERRGLYLADIFSSLSFAKEIRLGCLGDWLLRKLQNHAEQSEQIYAASTKYRKTSGYVTGTTTLVQQIISYTYLVRQVIAGAVTVGGFAMYSSAVSTFTGSMRDILSRVVQIREFRPYYDAAKQYFEVTQNLRRGDRPIPRAGSHTLEMRSVCFRYPGQNHDVLHGVNLTWRSGEKLSLVGENGSGKTTIVKLLTRLYDPTEGVILLDDVDIREFDYDEYMSLFAVVFQDFSLFALSLRENICQSEGAGIEDEAILEALNRSGFALNIDRLNKGLDTSIYKQFDETGFEPSGGEAQQIALARALLKDAPVVILDEPTSALDPEAEYNMYQRFNRLVRDKSALFISHRLASCKFCDRILVLQQGRVIEEGSHADLMNDNGYYARLFSMQAGLYGA